MTDDGLAEVGLRVGEVVRYRPRPSARWQEVTVTRRERDGSIGVVDAMGSARALPLERLEVRVLGPRGAHLWEPATRRAARPVQRDLFDP